MAEPQIVSCPGCGKRYSVPAGVAPGQFQCQDCSAVVVYGRNADPPGGKAHSASARTHAKAAAAKRKLARERSRHADDDYEEEERPRHGPLPAGKRQNPMVYVMGIVGFAVLAGGAAFLLTQTKSEPPKKAGGSSAQVPVPVPPPPTVPDPGETPKAAPPPPPPPERGAGEGGEAPRPSGGLRTAVRGGVADKPDTFTPAANPPTGSHYGKSQAALLMMLREKRPEVWVDPGHLPDTPSDLASKIDADIAKMADVNGGSDFLRAQDRLVKIGRPALPKVIGLLSRLDFSKYSNMRDAADACALGDAIDNVMHAVTGYDKIPRLQYNPVNGKLSEYTETLDAWCLWWFTIGYKRETFYKASGAEAEEKL